MTSQPPTGTMKELMSAALFGLFDSMIQDIPKHKKQAHIKKLEWLVEIGFIKNISIA